MSHAIMPTELTFDGDGVVWPVESWEGSSIVYHLGLLHNDHLLLPWRSHHHLRLHLHWLSCCWVNHDLLLHHRLSGRRHHRLPCRWINHYRLHHWLSHWLHHRLLLLGHHLLLLLLWHGRHYGLCMRSWSCRTTHKRLTLLIIDFVTSFIGH